MPLAIGKVEQLLAALPSIRRRTGLAYTIGIGLFAISLAARIALQDLLPPGLPYFTFFIAVLLSTLLGGIGPGIVALLLSVVAAWHLLLPTKTSLQISEAVAASFLFIVICSMIILVVHLLNQAVERLLKAQDRAETQLYLTAMAEQRLKHVNDELKHRNKNTFAMIAALVAQGSRREKDVGKFAEALRGRLLAMGTAQDLILGNQLQGTDLKALITKTVEPIVPPGKNRLEIEGAEFFLPTEIATSLALVIHELATNCLKYGSWSNDKGRTAVRWTLEQLDGQETDLVLTWRETGGPAVQAPERSGFGTQLIERTLPDSKVERTFAPSGLTCAITLHIRNLNTLKNGIRPRREDGDTFTFSR